MPESEFAESAEVALELIREEAGEHQPPARWVDWASLSSMLMAVVAAAAGLLAGMTGNEALIERQEELQELIQINRVALETEVLLTRLAVLQSIGQEPDAGLRQRLDSGAERIEAFTDSAHEAIVGSKTSLKTHEVFAIAATLLSVAITVTGMAVILRRRRLWYGSLTLGTVGLAAAGFGLSKFLA